MFGYWRDRDVAPLLAALGVAGVRRLALTFEEPLPTGLAGDAPTTDVRLDLADGRYVAIESKYGEWLVRRPRNKRVFKDKYFPQGGERRLGGRRVAAVPSARRGPASRPRAVQVLHAAQLLKHALGLKRSVQRTACSCTCTTIGRGARRPRIARRSSACWRGSCPRSICASLTYQALFRALCAEPTVARDYVDYLGQRYFA